MVVEETQYQLSNSKAKETQGWKRKQQSNYKRMKRKPSQPSFVQCPTFKVHLWQHMKSVIPTGSKIDNCH